jgi:hypothetical protein
MRAKSATFWPVVVEVGAMLDPKRHLKHGMTTFVLGCVVLMVAMAVWQSGQSASPATAQTPVTINSPLAGATVSGTITVSGTAAAPQSLPVTEVRLQIDGGLAHLADGTSSWFWSLNTLLQGAGSHVITVTASDSAGDVGSATVTINVDNSTLGGQAPPKRGYFGLQAVGSWSSLPSDISCTSQVHYSRWEPRPDNTKRNNIMPYAAAAHQYLALRPRDTASTYNPEWDSWLLQRVDGQFAGTTDEIFQWAACKWGLPDNLLRAVAVRESTWYQYETYPTNRCVTDFGCGDFFSSPTADTTTYCGAIASHGYDYQADYGAGYCPKTFSIAGVMDWEAPSWGAMLDNQNGTFPFNRDSTAFAVDYLGAYLRGCYEGWVWWLKNTGTGKYAAGDIWGCVGSWYSGDWHSSAANTYISNVQHSYYVWLSSSWPSNKPGCNTYGCPGPDTLAPDSVDS